MGKKTSNEAAAMPPEQSGPVATVRMTRDPVYGEPTTADVHPDEGATWQEHGWEIAE